MVSHGLLGHLMAHDGMKWQVMAGDGEIWHMIASVLGRGLIDNKLWHIMACDGT